MGVTLRSIGIASCTCRETGVMSLTYAPGTGRIEQDIKHEAHDMLEGVFGELSSAALTASVEAAGSVPSFFRRLGGCRKNVSLTRSKERRFLISRRHVSRQSNRPSPSRPLRQRKATAKLTSGTGSFYKPRGVLGRVARRPQLKPEKCLCSAGLDFSATSSSSNAMIS